MVIRSFRPEDADAVIAVVHSVFTEFGFTWDEHGYHQDLYDIPGHYPPVTGGFWVAEVEGKVRGCAGLVLFPSIPGAPGTLVKIEGTWRVAGTDAELVRMYVHQSARRLGLGRALAAAVIDEARARGANAIELWSDKRFGPAHALYGSLGAAIVGERVCDDPDESPEWGLRLPL